MRYWKNDKTLAAYLMLLCIAGLYGCGRDPQHGLLNRLLVKSVQVQENRLVARLDVQLSATVAQALDRGIPLALILETRFASATPTEWQARIVLNYHAMTRQYQLILPAGDAVTRTFPSRRALLAALRRSVRLQLPAAYRGDVPLRSRLRLDRSALPAPLRLPAYVMPSWQTRTPWLLVATPK